MEILDFGLWCEDQAAEYLKTVKGWSILERRVRFREGEIDLIARHSEALVFVEVKGLRSRTFGAVVEHVTAEKVRRMKRAIMRWRMCTDCFLPGELLFLGVTLEHGQVFFEELSME